MNTQKSDRKAHIATTTYYLSYPFSSKSWRTHDYHTFVSSPKWLFAYLCILYMLLASPFTSMPNTVDSVNLKKKKM